MQNPLIFYQWHFHFCI